MPVYSRGGIRLRNTFAMGALAEYNITIYCIAYFRGLFDKFLEYVKWVGFL